MKKLVLIMFWYIFCIISTTSAIFSWNVLWLKADSTSCIVWNNCTSWDDHSVNNNSIETIWTVRLNAADSMHNFHPYFSGFTASNFFRDSATSIHGYIPQQQDYKTDIAIFSVWRTNWGSSNWTVVWMDNDPQYWAWEPALTLSNNKVWFYRWYPTPWTHWASPNTITVNKTSIFSMDTQNYTNLYVWLDWKYSTNIIQTGWILWPVLQVWYSDSAVWGLGWAFPWSLQEVIFYKWIVSSLIKNSMLSYLAVKYWITLDQTATWQNYVDGSWNIIWNTNTNSGYKNNIFGIWRDDSTSLYQKQSQSVNTWVLTIALNQLSATNQTNTWILSDRNFVVWWDNNWLLNLSETFNWNANSRLWRVWKFEKTGIDTPLIEMIFTWITTSWLSMIISPDEVFDVADSFIPLADWKWLYKTKSNQVFYVTLWLVNYYTLSFEEDGGNSVLDQTGIVYNTTGNNSWAPIRSWYIFSGWYLSWWSIPFDFMTPITGDTTLYAQRNIAKYNVTFVDYDGTVLQTGLVQYGSSAVAVIPATPTRTGYTFSWWNPSDLSNITGDKVFTGEYTHTVYTLSFDTAWWNTITPITWYYMSWVIVPNNPTKVWYIFSWWNENIPTTMPLWNKTFVTQRKPEIVFVTWYAGWWGGYSLTKDNCPNGDYSQTYYDGSCGTKPVVSVNTWKVEQKIFNPTIANTCFTPIDKTTIYQWNDVTQWFRTAHQMLYSYGLTVWRGTVDYRPYDGLTREEAAKFMVEFARNVLCREKTRTYSDRFSDIVWTDKTLLLFIKESYEYEIFNGDKDNDGDWVTTFRPFDRISHDELATIMIRLITHNKYKNEATWDDRAAFYKEKLINYSKDARLTDNWRSIVAEVIYDLYRNNTYKLENIGYIVQ